MRISYKHLGRYKEIAAVLIKYGFGFVVEKMNKDSVASKVLTRAPKGDIKDLSTGQRLRCAFEELGPTYVKIGQIMSTRKDILSDDIIVELSKLRDNVSGFDTVLAMSILKEELEHTGLEIDEVFSSISQEPLASASIGQVYDARLKINGQKVVVKIQRPGIENTIKSDLAILKKLAKNFETMKLDWDVDITELISQLEVQLLRELDYKFEAVNGIKLGKIFENSKEVFIPKVYNDYTTRKVLVMEKVEGICLSDVYGNEFSEEEKKKIVDIGVRSFFRQVMTCGFFHADPHPGNIFVLSDKRVAYIDFGMIGLIDDKTLGYLNQLIIASTNKNIDKIIRVLMDMNAIAGKNNNEALRRDLLYLIHYYYDLPFDKLSIAEILNEIFLFMRNYHIKLPSQLVVLGKTVITLEGTSRGLYKDFSVESIGRAYLRYYKEEKLDFRRNAKVLKSTLDDYYYDLVTVPSQLKAILTILEKNNLKLDVGEFTSPRLEESIRKFTTQVSMSIMLAACIVGSSLIMASENIQKSQVIKFVSVLGFIISFIIGIALVFLILKNNYHKNK